jgi:transcriptional regulator of met regulon
MLKKPVVIRIYDDDGKVSKEYKLCIVPWRLVKRATSVFTKMQDSASDQEAEVDEMTNLLCDAFKGSFTPEDLNEHADAGEVMEAINAIISDINAVSPNAPAGPRTPRN